MCLLEPLLSQTEFAFKDDRLGMTLQEFETKHVSPGHWVSSLQTYVAGGWSALTDLNNRPKEKGDWKWKPDLSCNESEGLSWCEYATTVATVPVRARATFVEQRLAVVMLSYSSAEPSSPRVEQALTDKFGPGARIAGSQTGLYALRWDNGISVVEFENLYCGSTGTDLEVWSAEVTEIVRGVYCDHRDGTKGDTVIWYVHKSLASLAMTRWRQTREEIREKAIAEPFSFNAPLQMTLQDFKSKHSVQSCKEVAVDITECLYSDQFRGHGLEYDSAAEAIFAESKLAATRFWFYYIYRDDLKPLLIRDFGKPATIPGYGFSAFDGDGRRALQWDEGGSIVEYEVEDCSDGDEYDKMTKILQGQYCGANYSSSGAAAIWHIDKGLARIVLSRHKDAVENARKKARSDM